MQVHIPHASNFLNTAHSPLKGLKGFLVVLPLLWYWISNFSSDVLFDWYLITGLTGFMTVKYKLHCFSKVTSEKENITNIFIGWGKKFGCCDWLKRKIIVNVLTTKLCLNFRSTFPRSGASRSGRNLSMRRCVRMVVWSRTELLYSTNPTRGPSRPGWTDRGSNLFIVIWTIERIKQHLGLLLLVLWFSKM